MLRVTLLLVAAAVMATAMPFEATDKVSVGFYMDFTTSTLANTLSAAGVSAIMDLTMVPYGNAHTTGTTITCQHGADECAANVIETCIIHHNPGVDAYFPAIKCIEGSGDPLQYAEKCCKDNNVDWNVVHKCSSGQEGVKLEYQMGNATAALQPPHKYVPWVVVNGAPLSNPDELLTEVCKAYKGSSKPAGCSRTTSEQKRCYRED